MKETGKKNERKRQIKAERKEEERRRDSKEGRRTK